MKIGLTANPRKPVAMSLARRAVELIDGRAEVVVADESAGIAPDVPHKPIEDLDPDVLIAIGGDGTFLYTLRRSDAPLLPINAGTVGVLAEVEASRPNEFEGAIERLLKGFYFLEERMKLAALVGNTPVPDATNDFVLHSAQVGKMGLFEIAFDGHVAGHIRADGLILASPTGSTAYSLSSLGPIVDPGLDAIVLTSIAPFRVEARAIVIEPLRTVRLRPVVPGRGALVIADGQDEYPLPLDSALMVYRSPRRATLVRFGTRFFQRLRGKRILPWTENGSEGGTSVAGLPPHP
ncbi:MAG: NAD(+)/NADH kinase [Thermoplasmata archaeon]